MDKFVTVEEVDLEGKGDTFRFWPKERSRDGRLLTCKAIGDGEAITPGMKIPEAKIIELRVASDIQQKRYANRWTHVKHGRILIPEEWLVDVPDNGDETDSYSVNDYETAKSENRAASDGTVCKTEEGCKTLETHFKRERDSAFIGRIKSMRDHVCDICGSRPDDIYGVEIIEGHHKVPVSSFDDNHEVTDEDIALLCPNCHRAVHRMMGEDESATYSSVKEEIKALLDAEK